ncbi:hypothetical protein [Peptoniphilus raoultii]|uniref:hypothetical protein n=1 Tax=Peptoniphilus raoultii TaxID=1776387 RepID=UPI0008DAE69D|nr:hypothetical protein [Peptoniphilus raoultii]
MKKKLLLFFGLLLLIFCILFLKTGVFKSKSVPEAYNINKKIYMEENGREYFYKDLVISKGQSILLTDMGEKFSFEGNKEIIFKIYGYPLIKRGEYENYWEKDFLINFSDKESFDEEKSPQGEFYIDSKTIKGLPDGDYFPVLTNLGINYYIEKLSFEIVDKGAYPNSSEIIFVDGKTFKFKDLDIFKADGNLKFYPLEFSEDELKEIVNSLEGSELLDESEIYALAPDIGSYAIKFYGQKGESYLYVYDSRKNDDGFYYAEFVNEEDGNSYSLKMKDNLFDIIKVFDL